MALRRWQKQIALALLAAAILPFLVIEGFYHYQLSSIPDLPSPPNGGMVPPKIKQAVSAALGQVPEIYVKPVWPWSLAKNWLRTWQGKSSDAGASLANVVAKEWLRDRRLAPQPTAWRELALTVWLTRHFSTTQLLDLWAHTVRAPNAGTSLDEVSRYYFGRPASELRREEAALLVGSLLSQVQFDPHCNPVRAKERRDVVLQAMQRAGIMTSEEAQHAIERPVELAPRLSGLPSCR